MEDTYAAIGRAVVATQMFETALIPIFEFFKMHTKPGYLEKTGGYISAEAFKIPIKNIVNMLRDQGTLLRVWKIGSRRMPKIDTFRSIAGYSSMAGPRMEMLTASFQLLSLPTA